MILSGIKKKLGSFSLSVERLAIGPGIYGLIGPNGSGKSTLAKIMTGLLEPDSGSVDTEGLSQKEITYLDRKPYMLDDTVYNNLLYPLKIRNIKPDRELIESFLDRMKLSHIKNNKARNLSGGEQQKLAFLRAIIFRPKLIVADEAMTNMDLDSLETFERTIEEEQKKENSVWIIISHQITTVRRICGSFIFIYDGKVEAEGHADKIFNEENNPRIKQYLRFYNSQKYEDRNSDSGITG